jgi:periplasmic divalent cation tolerance protein
MADDYAIVLTTMPAEADAEALARTLVEEHLAACINVLPPMTSIYRWEGTIDEASERQLLIKTARSRIGALRDRIAELHPYDVPEFVVLPITGGSEAYLDWIRQSVQLADPRT